MRIGFIVFSAQFRYEYNLTNSAFYRVDIYFPDYFPELANQNKERFLEFLFLQKPFPADCE